MVLIAVRFDRAFVVDQPMEIMSGSGDHVCHPAL